MYELAKRLAKMVNPLLEPLEAGSATTVSPAPILIVGSPRSGTTLLFQLLVQHFDVAYLSNLHHAVYGAPVLLERLVPRRFRRPPPRYESRFGVTNGPWAPSEAGNFWYRFFPINPHAVGPADFSDEARRRLRRAVGALTRAARRPFVAKNVVCSVRLEAIAGALPEMRYIVMHRDQFDVATSILAARREANGNYDAWWSVEPVEIDRLRSLPPEEQVVEQVRAVERSIQEAQVRLGAERFVHVDFPSVAADPAGQLALLGTRLGMSRRASTIPVPASFDERSRPWIEPELTTRLQAYLRR